MKILLYFQDYISVWTTYFSLSTITGALNPPDHIAYCEMLNKMNIVINNAISNQFIRLREGVQKKNVPFSSLLLLRGPATPPLSSPVGN